MGGLHFTEAYRGYLRDLISAHPLDAAMAIAVGGAHDYAAVGAAEADLIESLGLLAGQSLIDIGCGSGRLSGELGRRFGASIEYLGTDIAPEVLDYARSRAPASYQFVQHAEPSIPAPASSADFIVAFSLFTHLLHEESFLYLRSAKRALKPNGRIVFSFVEAARHWDTFEAMTTYPGRTFTIFIERPMIETWAEKLGLAVDAYDPAPFGQSVAVLRII
jgi:ubiquinone/menaquinone biosynthesis C-methylase UbiE